MNSISIPSALECVPPGSWAVGVSGGADSTCLLYNLHELRSDLPLHVVHLNHQTRGAESDGDAAFVAELARRLSLPCTVAKLSDLPERPPQNNAAADFRAARMALFTDVVSRHRLQGVILAHHAEDRAETILQRLLRGTGPSALGGIAFCANVAELKVLHPLITVSRETLQEDLARRGVAWREDASNTTPRYQRNRVRQVLGPAPALTDALLHLGDACAELRQWMNARTPNLPLSFPTGAIENLPDPLAAHALRRWLCTQGSPSQEISPATLERLLKMARDAASPARQHFPGGVLVRRRRGMMDVIQKR